jgi:hypothetical protein
MTWSFLRCDHCGALAEPTTRSCRYCGAVPVRCDDLIAATFGDADGTWEVTPPVPKTRVERIDASQLRVDLPPRTEVSGASMPCAWTRGDFVDVDASVAIVFEAPAEGCAAGLFLRSSATTCVCVLLHPSGAVSALVDMGGGTGWKRIGDVASRGAKAPLAATMLRARLVRDVLTIYVDGTPAAGITCPTGFTGPTDLVAQVGDREPSRIRFIDPSAKIP